MILVRTPLRISFFGGGTDYPKYCNRHTGAVLGTTINKFIYISYKNLLKLDKYNFKITYSQIEKKLNHDQINHKIIKKVLKENNIKGPIEMNIISDVPAKTGLGSSSSFIVSLLHMISILKKKKLNKLSLRDLAIKFELQTNKNVGYQDQTFAAHGGFNFFKFKKKKLEIHKIRNQQNINKLEKNLLMIYIRGNRDFNKIAKNINKNIENSKNIRILNEIYNHANEGYRMIKSENFKLKEFGQLFEESWQFKKKTSSKISNLKVDVLSQRLIDLGAYGTKLFGVGGSGFMGVVCNKKIKEKILTEINLPIMQPKFYSKGSEQLL